MKRVAYCMYVHKSNIVELYYTTDMELLELLNKTRDLYSYDIIKVNTKGRTISYISSEDWNESFEPIVGVSYCVHLDGSVKEIKGNNKVYHNKWQFVMEGYTGFDITLSKERTKQVNKIEKVNKNKSKIGNLGYWRSILVENNLPVFMP